MIIGYSILYIDDDTNLKDVLWSKRIVYNSWEKVIEIANIKSLKTLEEYKNIYGESILLNSLIKKNSQQVCDNSGNVRIYQFVNNEKNQIIEISNIYIIPIFNE